jgi:hypothetical protein
MTKINWTQVAVFGGVALLVFLIGTSVLSFFGQGYGYGGWGSGGMMGPGMMSGRGPGGMMGGYGSGLFGWLFMLPMCLFPLGLLVLLVVGIVWLVRAVSSAQPAAPVTKVCPECHSAVQAGWKACPHCGATLVESARE